MMGWGAGGVRQGNTGGANERKNTANREGAEDWEEGRANEGDVMQVRREGRPGRNSGNRAGLINQIQDRCVGKLRLVRSTGKQKRTEEGTKNHHINLENTHKMNSNDRTMTAPNTAIFKLLSFSFFYPQDQISDLILIRSKKKIIKKKQVPVTTK